MQEKKSSAPRKKSKEGPQPRRTVKKVTPKRSGEIKDFLLSQIEVLRSELVHFSKSKDPARMHPLRVSIKKIRAAHAFLKNKGTHAPSIAGILKIFRRAAKIRELHVLRTHETILRHLPDKVLSRLSKKESEQTDKLIRKIPDYLELIGKQKLKYESMELSEGSRDFTGFAGHQMEAAVRDAGSARRDRIHRLRKRIKRMIYLVEAAPGLNECLSNKDLELLSQLQRKIGDWHDLHHSILILDPHSKDPDLKKRIRLLRLKEEARFRALLKTINGKQVSDLLARKNTDPGAS